MQQCQHQQYDIQYKYSYNCTGSEFRLRVTDMYRSSLNYRLLQYVHLQLWYNVLGVLGVPGTIVLVYLVYIHCSKLDNTTVTSHIRTRQIDFRVLEHSTS